jgi:hypothetical protein
VPHPDYQITPAADPPIGGWLLLLCLLLLIWQPLNVGLTASRTLNSLALGGLPVALVLVLRLLVAGLGIAAALALLNRRTGAVNFARGALVVSAATDLFVELTPYTPLNRAPGETPVFVAASLIYYGAWLLYLSRSRRVRRTYGNG